MKYKCNFQKAVQERSAFKSRLTSSIFALTRNASLMQLVIRHCRPYFPYALAMLHSHAAIGEKAKLRGRITSVSGPDSSLSRGLPFRNLKSPDKKPAI